jgi:hypothetical protein
MLKYAKSSKYSHDVLKVYDIAFAISHDIDPEIISDPDIDSRTAHTLTLCLIDGIDIKPIIQANLTAEAIINYRAIYNRCSIEVQRKINRNTFTTSELIRHSISPIGDVEDNELPTTLQKQILPRR